MFSISNHIARAIFLNLHSQKKLRNYWAKQSQQISFLQSISESLIWYVCQHSSQMKNHMFRVSQIYLVIKFYFSGNIY